MRRDLVARQAPDPFELVLLNIVTHGNVARACRECNVERSSFYWRINSDPVYLDRYTRAKHLGMHALADEIIEIADTCNPKESHKTHLRVEARKWLLSKLAPKVYGERFAALHAENVNLVPPMVVIQPAEITRGEPISDDGIAES